jgi:hypothetical protein
MNSTFSRLPQAGVLLSYLSARVGCAQKVADSGTSDCRGGASITTLNCRDGSNGDLFLTVARFRNPRVIPDDGSARDVGAGLLLHTVTLRLKPLSEFE